VERELSTRGQPHLDGVPGNGFDLCLKQWLFEGLQCVEHTAKAKVHNDPNSVLLRKVSA
jgi:hypothetical protein